MFKKFIFTLILALGTIILPLDAYSNYDNFAECIRDNNLVGAKKIIDNWIGNKNKDPQYFIAQYNYHLALARENGLVIRKGLPKEGQKEIKTEKDLNEVKELLTPSTEYSMQDANNAIKWITKGIALFPDHYEMRFGLMWLYGELEQHEKYLTVLHEALQFLRNKKLAAIYWNNNQKVTAVNDFLTDVIQANAMKMMQDDKHSDKVDFFIKYFETMINFFPQHKYGYNDLGSVYIQLGKYELAKDYFLKASKIDATDEMILYNIGYSYLKLNDKKAAKTFFEKVVKTGKNQECIASAEKKLAEISGK